MQRSLSGEANTFSSGQEIHPLYGNRDFIKINSNWDIPTLPSIMLTTYLFYDL
jgi:hypothetical protein